MKRWITIVVMCLVLGGGHPAQAEEPSPTNRQDGEPPVVEKIATKLTRGVANFATGWLELPKQIYLVGHNEGWTTGALRGPIDGLGMFVARTIAGAYEVLTFLVPIPSQYQPMLRPDYVWEPELPERFSQKEEAVPNNKPQ